MLDCRNSSAISLLKIWIVEFIFTQTLYYETNSYSQITANNNNNNNRVGEGLYTLVDFIAFYIIQY